MFTRGMKTENRIFTLLLGMLAAILVICIVLFPRESFDASLQGLNIWWKIIFPSLLPFLILSEIAIAYGFLHFFGVIIEPFMRSIFRLPGISGPIMAIGCTVGFPTGAKLTSKLREQKLIGRKEGESLLALSHIGSPVLIVNIVAVGFFHNAKLGLFMIIIQWISLIIVGILMSLTLSQTSIQSSHSSGMLRRSFEAMNEAHAKDGRTFGKLLGDAVSSSVNTLMMIGGYIMIFSVIIKIMTLSQISNLFYALLNSVIPEEMFQSFVSGLFEVHLGSYMISQSEPTITVWQIAFVGCFLAWSGFSLHAQVKSLIHHTDLRYSRFLAARLLHSLFVLWLTFWLWGPFQQLFSSIQPVFLQLHSGESNILNIWGMWSVTLSLMLSIIFAMMVISIIMISTQKIMRFFNP